MNLNFSGLDLRSFDASKLYHDVDATESSFGMTNLNNSSISATDNDSSLLLGKHTRAIRSIDLSSNRLRSLTGVATLRHLTVLNLSHNALSTLTTSCLPAQLELLNVSHNRLSTLGSTLSKLTRLSELRARCNELTSAGIAELPASLRKLDLSHNRVSALTPLVRLSHLELLDVSHNVVDAMGEVESLAGLRSLRSLDLRGNPIAASPAVRSVVAIHVPRLRRLDGAPLAVVAAERTRTSIATRYSDLSRASHHLVRVEMDTSRAARANRSGLGDVTTAAGEGAERDGGGNSIRSLRAPHGGCAVSGRRRSPSGGELSRRSSRPIRLMKIKIEELRRMLEDTEQLERLERDRHAMLAEQIKLCAGVIAKQGSELEQLRTEIERLDAEKIALSEPAKQLEQTFEQTHASLLAHKRDVVRPR